MFRSFAAIAGSVLMLATGVVQAQTPAPATPPAPAATPEASKHPLGITFTATMTAVSDYSYRGISHTQRIPAFQPSITIETGPFSDQLPITAYVGAWASNVN